MASTPRASVFWVDSNSRTVGAGTRMSRSDSAEDYFVDEEDLEQQERLLEGEEEVYDGRTPLDKTIDRIGMGSYQWTLLSLCGLGWMADNMWIQAIAIILPRVQQHYNVPDSYIGAVSSSMFAGMMLGAVGWGTCSDLMGRITAFNATLFLTAVFGIIASLSNSFKMLCITLFLLGSSVGGSMPTDGTLLLEHMPKSKQYLVTALSVFFSFGAVLSAILGLLVIPQNSCLAHAPSSDTDGPCDPSTGNLGWKYLLVILALLTLTMFVARMVFFRLHESPRYLVHAGRPHDAIKSLELISRFNGSDLSIELEDVRDHHTEAEQQAAAAATVASASLEVATNSNTGSTTNPGVTDSPARPRATSRTVFDATMIEDTQNPLSRASSSESTRGARQPLMTAYAAIGEIPSLGSKSASASASGRTSPTKPAKPLNLGLSIKNRDGDGDEGQGSSMYPPPHTKTVSAIETELHDPTTHPHHAHTPTSPTFPVNPTSTSLASPTAPTTLRTTARRRSTSESTRRRASIYEQRLCWSLPRWVRKPLWAWWDRVMMVLAPEWVRTTVLVWTAWWAMSLAYTMFNVFLPKLLETGSGSVVLVESTGPSAPGSSTPKTLEQSLWDVVIFTIGGCPGAILGAYLIESRLGRRWSLAGSTFITALFCVIFAMVKANWAIRFSTVGISLSATTMWAVLYGWTPEIFDTKVRGTAGGIASALSRIGGMIAPILGGILLMIDRTLPVYISVAVFVVAGFSVLLLRETPRGALQEKGAPRSLMH